MESSQGSYHPLRTLSLRKGTAAGNPRLRLFVGTRSAEFANKELPLGLFHELAKRRRDTVGLAPCF